MGNITVKKSQTLSGISGERFVVADKDAGEMPGDAQGYGYRSAQKAYAAYSYKNRDKSKDKEKAAKKARIKKRMKERKDFAGLMDGRALDAAKGAGGPDGKLDAESVRKLLEECGLKPDFTPGELLRAWRNS